MLWIRFQAQELDYLHVHLVFEACYCITSESLCLVYNLVSLCLVSLPPGAMGSWGMVSINSKASTGSLRLGIMVRVGDKHRI